VGDIGDKDQQPRDGNLAKERLDAVLTSGDITTQQALAALDVQWREHQGTFPHAVEITVMTSTFPGEEHTIPLLSYIGPFVDRRAAEAWAAENLDEMDGRVSWQALKMETPEQFEELRRAIRDIVDSPAVEPESGPKPTESQMTARRSRLARPPAHTQVSC
jgi:hypothetical protein